MAGRKKRNSGCKCGGRNPCACMANPRKRRNPSSDESKNLDILVFSPPHDLNKKKSAEAWFASMRLHVLDAPAGSPDRKERIAKAKKALGYGSFLTRGSAVSKFYAAAGAGVDNLLDTVANPRKRRNPVHAVSEDYRIGLFQGAMERGHLPPPNGTSADLKRGYSDGAKVAKAKPNVRAEALGVFKATSDQHQAGSALYEAAKGGVSTLQNPRKRRNGRFFDVVGDNLYEDGKLVEKAGPYSKCADVRCNKPAAKYVKASWGSYAWFCAKHAAEQNKLSKQRNPTREEHLKRGARRYKSAKDELAKGNYYDALVEATLASSDFYDGKNGKVPFEFGESRNLANKAFMASKGRSAGVPPRRNPSSAASRKHLAHEREEEATFAAMMHKLPIGVTIKAGKHRVRKLSKGFVVVDGERLTEKQAAAKIHRG